MFFDETAKIEAHESEVLCVEFSPTESGMTVILVFKSNSWFDQSVILFYVSIFLSP